MAKKGSRPFLKKNFPGMQRVTDESGKRIWKFEGKTFNTKNDIYLYKNPPKEGVEKLVDEVQQVKQDLDHEVQKMSVPQ